jgi:hypothetical protein
MISTIATYLWIAGSLPFIILGSIHLMYTFFTNKFSSRTASVDDAMKKFIPQSHKRNYYVAGMDRI